MAPLLSVDTVAVQPPLNTSTVIENSVSGARTRKSSTGSLDTLTSIAITAAVTTTSSVKYVCDSPKFGIKDVDEGQLATVKMITKLTFRALTFRIKRRKFFLQV